MEAAADAPAARAPSPTLALLRRLPWIPLLMLAPMLVFGLFGGWFIGEGGVAPDLAASLQPPAWLAGGSWHHLLGTDQFGRDLLLRLIEGARVSLVVCVAGVLMAACIGVAVGVVAGYAGGVADTVLMRLVDVQMSVPAVLLTLLIGAAIGPGLWTVVISIVLVFWADYARVIRSETMTLCLRPFVDLARVANASAARIVLRHILPNLVPSILVLMTLQFGRGLIIEAAITFIGLGIQPPDTAWGTLIAEGRSSLETAWWIPTFAGLLITLTVLGANLLGDRIRDRLDPQTPAAARMKAYLLRRLVLGVVTLLGVVAFVFVAVRASGDVVQLLAPPDATAEQVQAMRHELGLDQPLPVQFGHFMADAARGRLGDSTRYGAPAAQLVLQRLPATLELAAAAFAFAVLAGIALGVSAARARGTWLDSFTAGVAVLGQAVPHFWIGIMAILVFGVKLGWLPTSGRGGLDHLVLPALTLGLFSLAAVARLTRSSMLDVLGADFVTFLRARGVGERRVVWLHALRNALVPVTALAGLQLSALIGNAVIIETVFNWPGLGSLMVEAVMNRDYPVVQAGVLLVSAMLIAINIGVDALFALIDPRIRLAT